MLLLAVNFSMISAQVISSNDVIIATSIASNSFVSRAVLAYRLLSPANITLIIDNSDSSITGLLQRNSIDLGIVMNSINSTNAAAYPSIAAYPIFAAAVLPIYNLQLAGNAVVALDMKTVARIYTGRVTWWNDSAIQATNPSIVMPQQPITVVINSNDMSINTVFSAALSPHDTEFASLFVKGQPPLFPFLLYSAYIISSNFYSTSLQVFSNNGSIGITQPESAEAMNATSANMVNSAGVTVSANIQSITVAASARGVSSVFTNYSDCSSAASPFAFPFCGYFYVLYDTTNARTTCTAKQSALAFLHFLMTSTVSAALVTTISILPSSVAQTANLPAIAMTCNGIPLTLAADYVLLSAGTAAVKSFLTPSLAFYTASDHSNEGSSFVLMDGKAAVQKLLSNDIDIALVMSEQVEMQYSGFWHKLIATDSIRVLPFAAVAAIPIYSLPAGIAALNCSTCVFPLYGNATTDRLQQRDDSGSYDGIVIDFAVLMLIFSGAVTRWDSELVLQFNPSLRERFAFAAAHNISINTNITLLISNEALAPALQVIAFANNHSIPSLIPYGMANQSMVDAMNIWTLPYVWNVQQLQQLNQNVKVFATERQLQEATVINSGSISYKLSTGQTSDYHTDIRQGEL